MSIVGSVLGRSGGEHGRVAAARRGRVALIVRHQERNQRVAAARRGRVALIALLVALVPVGIRPLLSRQASDAPAGIREVMDEVPALFVRDQAVEGLEARFIGARRQE